MSDNATIAPVHTAVLLDIDATAKALALCSKTVRKLVRDGLLPVVRIGRAVRFDPRDFPALIDRLKAGLGEGGKKFDQNTLDSAPSLGNNSD